MKNKLLGFLILLQLSAASQSDQFYIPYRQNNRWGFCDTSGNVRVKPAFDSTSFLLRQGGLQKGAGRIYSAKGEGIVSFSGKVLVPPVYDSVDKLMDHYVVVSGRNVGLYDTTGQMVIPVQYEDVYPADYDKGYVAFRLKGKTGLYHAKTKQTFPALYDKIISIFYSDTINANDWFYVEKGRQKFLIRKVDGKLIPFKGRVDEPKDDIPPMVEELQMLPEPDDFLSSLKEKFGVDRIEHFKGEEMYSGMNSSLYLVEKNGKKGLASAKEMLLQPAYDSVMYALGVWEPNFVPFSSKYLFAVGRKGKFGIINEKGEQVLPFEYDLITQLKGYEKDFELTKKNKKGAYSPFSSHSIISPKYDAISFAQELGVYQQWRFFVYKVMVNNKDGFVGENGVEYFKN